MSFQIERIILFSNSGDKREVIFELGKVNIITGASKTGKSAISEIISYCLGSKEFNVPAGIIRESVQWYCVVLQFELEQVLVGRPSPKKGFKTSTEIFLENKKDATDVVYEQLMPNTNIDGLSSFLSSKIGITDNLQVPGQYSTQTAYEAQINHALTFNFQQQGEVANKNLIFHRQDKPFVANSIKLTAPYFLGAYPDNLLKMRVQLQEHRKLLKKFESELAETQKLQGDGNYLGYQLLTEAEQVGLINVESHPENLKHLIELLTPLKDYRSTHKDLKIQGEPLTRLNNEKHEIVSKYFSLKEDIKLIKKYIKDFSDFSVESNEQKARISTMSLIPIAGGHIDCPMCGNSNINFDNINTEIKTALSNLDSQLSGVTLAQPKLTSHLANLEGELKEVKTRLDFNQTHIDKISTNNLEMKSIIELESRRGRCVGKISLYIESVKVTDDLGSMKTKIELERAEVVKLERFLENSNFESVLESNLQFISKTMTDWAKFLDLENSPNAFRLQLRDLTVIIDTKDGPISLQEMGSGANWVGCHLITYMALHKWFIEKKRPVPRFLILDQPSQVFYPPENDKNDGQVENLEDEDRLAVAKMFQWLIDTTMSLKPGFQLIIADHVDIKEEWFSDCVRERWRHGKALIPAEWSL